MAAMAAAAPPPGHPSIIQVDKFPFSPSFSFADPSVLFCSVVNYSASGDNALHLDIGGAWTIKVDIHKHR